MHVRPIMVNAWTTAGRMDKVGPFTFLAQTGNGYEFV
jgi:hypothetical protein